MIIFLVVEAIICAVNCRTAGTESEAVAYLEMLRQSHIIIYSFQINLVYSSDLKR